MIALALVIIVMVVLMILGTAVLKVAVAENRFSKKSEDKIQAYYVALTVKVVVSNS